MTTTIYSQHYPPYGSALPGLQYNYADDRDTSKYRFGFNTQEAEEEIAGEGNIFTAEFWEYDARLGRRWNRDPIRKVWESPYACFLNNPIYIIDPFGLDGEPNQEVKTHVAVKGNTYWGLSKKYNVSVAQLREWNGYDDKKIPIGAVVQVSDIKLEPPSDYHTPKTYEFNNGEEVTLLHYEEFDWRASEAMIINDNIVFPDYGALYGGSFALDYTLTANEDPNNFYWIQTVKTNMNYDRDKWNFGFTDPLKDVEVRDGKNGIMEKGFRFTDTPGRPAHKDGMVYWKSELSFVRKNDDGSFERLFTVSYGFIVESRDVACAIPLSNVPNPSIFHLNTIKELK
jgi:hypothetical protein